MVRTIWRPSSVRRDESTPRHQGVLSAARSMLTSGRGGRGPSLSSSIRHPPSTIDSNASNPLLPERRDRHPSERRRIAALESLRSRLESSRLRTDDDNPSSILQSDGISDEEEPSQPLTQPPEILAPPTLSPLPSPPPALPADDYIPPSDADYPPVPPKAYNAILHMLSSVWKIENPREYQIKAIFYLVFLRVRMMYLVRKTGEGSFGDGYDDPRRDYLSGATSRSWKQPSIQIEIRQASCRGISCR
jgi:hypothetical protein